MEQKNSPGVLTQKRIILFVSAWVLFIPGEADDTSILRSKNFDVDIAAIQ